MRGTQAQQSGPSIPPWRCMGWCRLKLRAIMPLSHQWLWVPHMNGANAYLFFPPSSSTSRNECWGWLLRSRGLAACCCSRSHDQSRYCLRIRQTLITNCVKLAADVIRGDHTSVIAPRKRILWWWGIGLRRPNPLTSHYYQQLTSGEG